MSDRNCVLSIEVHGTYTYIYSSSFVFTYVARRQTDVTSMTESTKPQKARVILRLTAM